MITYEELTTYVEKWLAEEWCGDEIVKKEWEAIKRQMEPHYEPVPVSGWYVDEYGNENQDYAYEMVSRSASTYFEEFYDFCWMLGCTVWIHYDYWDGSPTYYISLPDREEEYQKNVAEGTANWKEVVGE